MFGGKFFFRGRPSLGSTGKNRARFPRTDKATQKPLGPPGLPPGANKMKDCLWVRRFYGAENEKEIEGKTDRRRESGKNTTSCYLLTRHRSAAREIGYFVCAVGRSTIVCRERERDTR